VSFIDLTDLGFLRSFTEKTKRGRYRNSILREEMEICRCLNKLEIKKNYNGMHILKELVYHNMLWNSKLYRVQMIGRMHQQEPGNILKLITHHCISIA
jgi:hypothetical protein